MTRVRWYQGYKCRKNPQELIKQISQKVQEYNLSQFIPLIRLEKQVKRRGEFYFFIAIESFQEGSIPQEIANSHFLKLPFFKITAAPGIISFNYDQIKGMVGAAHDVHDYTNPIPYQPLPKRFGEHPFNLTTAQKINLSHQDIDNLSHRHEYLIYWLSAIRYGTWESFKKSCEQLDIAEPKRVLRRLKLLGYIELSPDGKRWSIAPTAIVKMSSESDLQEFFVCGQRSINLLNQLKTYANLQSINQPQGDAPPCIRIQLEKSVDILSLLRAISADFSINDAGEASKKLARILPNINTWKHNLRDLQGIVTTKYQWEQFDGNDFVSCGLPRESGMYRMYNQDMNFSHPLRTLFYDRESNRWLQGDWYTLRFLALQQMEDECIFNYDLDKKQLAIPTSQRFPEIYERVLFLASGIVPTYIDSWLVYANIEPELVHLLSAKLNLVADR